MISPIQIPPVGTIDELRLALTSVINKLIAQINAESVGKNLDAGGNRITNVGDPSSLTDAVTKRWVLNQLEKLK